MKLRILSLGFRIMCRVCQGTAALHRAADRMHSRLFRACTCENLRTLIKRKQRPERFD